MQISEVMTRAVELADPDTPIKAAADKMRAENVGALPVGENDRLTGMVTDRDIAIRATTGDRPAQAMSIRNVMSEDVYYCFEDEELSDAGQKMAAHQVHRLPVLDRDKRLVGIVALADLARAGTEGKEAAVTAICGISEPTAVPRR